MSKLARVLRVLLVCVAMLLVVGCGSDFGEDGVDGQRAARFAEDRALTAASRVAPSPAGESRREADITRLLNRAIRAIARADGSCRRYRGAPDRASFSDGTPSADALATFAILRRPQTERERIPDRDVALVPGEGIYRSGYRIAKAANGRQYLLVVATNANGYRPPPAQCADLLRTRFAAEIANRSREFKRRARAALRQIIRDEWTADPKAAAPYEGFYLFDYQRNRPGGGGGGTSLEAVRSGRFLYVTWSASRAVISALVPDGVATVTLTFPRASGRDKRRRLDRSTRPVEVTAGVHDNVMSVEVPGHGSGATQARMTWEAADGSVIRVIPPPA